MKKSLFILAVILSIMMLSCKPQGEDGGDNSDNSGGGNNIINGHEYVDLGLPSGLKWATCNVGASSPEEYGDYYAWGETVTKTEYCTNNCVTYGQIMGDISGNVHYDAATAHWGNAWRMPTKSEMEELVYNCTFTWTMQNYVKGCKITGPNGNHIFLPAAGTSEDGELCGVGISGFYWTSTPLEPSYYHEDAYRLRFYDDGTYLIDEYKRYPGRSIRPVTD